MHKSEKVVLLIIMLVAAALRLFDFSEFSLSNDELSALARLNFDSFYDLIMEGVRIDGHPPAAQVLLWIVTRIFGDGVFAVRLPFVIAGIASVFFVFKMAKEWISTSSALIASAVFATLAYPILYSRLARPYALGMLFVSMAAFYWIRIVKKQERPSDYVLLALTLALCGFSHYFAALNGAILSILGLFLVRNSRLKKYVLSLVGGFLLFAPYITIFLYQLNTGGVGQWLGAPETDWLWNHISYAFNDSLFAMAILLVVSGCGFLVFKSKKSFVNIWLPLLLFLIPFIIGFFYSRWVNPVLQNSTLVFSFPFLLVFLFSGWKDGKRTLTMATASVLLLVISFSTVVSKSFFNTNQFGVFKELAVHVIDWNNELEEDAVLIGDYNAPFYIHYYLDKLQPIEFDLYRTSDDEGLRNLKKAVESSKNLHAIYSWSTVNQSPEIQEIIRDKFYRVLERETYFNSEAVLYKRHARPQPNYMFNFEKGALWNFNLAKVNIDTTGINLIRIDDESPYGPTFMLQLDSAIINSGTEIITRIQFVGLTDNSEVQLVYEQANEDGGYAWESDRFGNQVISTSSDWAVFHYQLKPNEKPGDLKIYPWSPKGEAFSISEMKIWFR